MRVARAASSTGARHLPGSVVLCALLAACSSGTAPSPDGGLPRDIAARPRPIRTVEEVDGTRGRGADPPAASPTATRGPDGETPPPPPPFVRVFEVIDRRGDHGLQAPDHGDLTELAIASNGVNARLSVRVAGPLPDPADEGEVIGIGIDLYRSATARESAYQLFAEGSDDGWFAWRHTPKGLAEYVGSFELGGDEVVFEVPWSALGRMRTGHARAFLDWSRAAPVLNQAGADRAPGGNDRARYDARS